MWYNKTNKHARTIVVCACVFVCVVNVGYLS